MISQTLDEVLSTVTLYDKDGKPVYLTANRSFFADCERDEHGYCVGEGDSHSSLKQLKQVREKVLAKYQEAQKPTKEEIAAAEQRIKKLGGTDNYERDIRGSFIDRARRRQRLLEEFGDGHTCPCGYCGTKLDDKTITVDKIYTSREGGRYHYDNIIPACEHCNKSRGDTPFKQIKWSKL